MASRVQFGSARAFLIFFGFLVVFDVLVVLQSGFGTISSVISFATTALALIFWLSGGGQIRKWQRGVLGKNDPKKGNQVSN